MWGIQYRGFYLRKIVVKNEAMENFGASASLIIFPNVWRIYKSILDFENLEMRAVLSRRQIENHLQYLSFSTIVNHDFYYDLRYLWELLTKLIPPISFAWSLFCIYWRCAVTIQVTIFCAAILILMLGENSMFSCKYKQSS